MSHPQAWIDVIAERTRQLEMEGWTPEHDDQHPEGQLALAAAAYAYAAGTGDGNRDYITRLPSSARVIRYWPWDWRWWKPTTRRRDLVKAAALILAEIERIDRKPSSTPNT